jgi:hypothetical protein
MSSNRALDQASQKTADDLRTIAHSQLVRELTPLTLPEVDAVVDLVSRVVPAGNVPGVILNGLARLPDRRLPLTTVRRDINLLFKGVEQALDRVTYGAFFAGPAAVIWGYQNLLKLVGKNPDDAFPEGTWQFYVEYALRDDTARHANETHGFDTVLQQHDICLSEADRMAAWLMAAIYAIHQYPALLENEWRERVYTFTLRELTVSTPDADRYKKIYRKWEAVRPYGRGADVVPGEDYPLYRRRKFDHFIDQVLRDLPSDVRRAWLDRVRAAEAEMLPPINSKCRSWLISIRAYMAKRGRPSSSIKRRLASFSAGIIICCRFVRRGPPAARRSIMRRPARLWRRCSAIR